MTNTNNTNDFDFLPDSIQQEVKAMPGKRLNNEEKNTIAVLRAQGKTPFAIGRQIGRSEITVSSALKTPEVAKQVEKFQERFAGKLEATAERILNAVTDADVEKASLRDKAISAGIFFDKSRLARGQSTSNVSMLFQVAEEAERLQRQAYAGGAVVDGGADEA